MATTESKPAAEACLAVAMQIWGERGERVRCELEGDCMVPQLRPGDELEIRLGGAEPHLGDVVMVATPRGRLVQRIVCMKREAGRCMVLLKPDRRWEFHPWTPAADLLGAVISVRRGGRMRRLDTWPARCAAVARACRSFVSGRTHAPDTRFWRACAALLRPFR